MRPATHEPDAVAAGELEEFGPEVEALLDAARAGSHPRAPGRDRITDVGAAGHARSGYWLAQAYQPTANRNHGLERVLDGAGAPGGMLALESSIGSGTRVGAKVPR